MDKTKFYTYAYLREDKTPYYIGKGKGYRINEKQGRIISLPPKERRIILKEFDNEFDAYKHEMYMIFIFGRKDNGTGILRNRSDGGEGASNVSKETRMYLSKLHKGKVLSKEAKEKISKANKGRKISDELKREYSIRFSGKGNPHYGIKHLEETLKKISEATKNKNLKTRYYVNPEGEVITVINLRQFCIDNNLIYNSMISLHNERMICHKGYKKYNPLIKKSKTTFKGKKHTTLSKTKMKLSSCKYVYHLESPDNKKYDVLFLKEFCTGYGLNQNAMTEVAAGKRKTHKGWTATRSLLTNRIDIINLIEGEVLIA